MSKAIFMETTEIPPAKTIAEIEAILIEHGANAVLKEYTAGRIEAVSFRMRVGPNDVPFRLPCRWQALAQVFRKRANISDRDWTLPYPWHIKRRAAIEEKAIRVGWRQILRWVDAQYALVETSMVRVEEVFFPYIQAPGGKTLFEAQSDKLMLAAGQP